MRVSIVLKMLSCGIVLATSLLALWFLGVAGLAPFARLAVPFAVIIFCVLLADTPYFRARRAASVFPSPKTQRNLRILTLVLATLCFALMLPLALRNMGR